MRRAVHCAVAIVALGSGCWADESATPAPPPGIPNRVIAPSEPPAVTGGPTANRWGAVRETGAARRASSANPVTRTGSPTPQDTPTQAAPPVARDFGEELRALASNPGSCLTQRAPGGWPSALHLAVSATVTPSGMITRAAVTGAGLTKQETKCWSALVTQARFRSPVEGAPRNVQTTVELRQRPQPVTPATAAPSSP